MNNNPISEKFRTLIIGGLMGLALTSPVSAAITAARTAEGITSFKSTVLVNSGEIKADSLIKAEGNSHVRNELAAILIGYIPNPLGELILDRKTLEKKLGNLSTRVEMPERVTIRRLGSILKGSDITSRIREICHETAVGELNIDLSRIPANLVLPGNISKWELHTSSTNTLGMKLFVLSAETDGGPFRQLIQVKVSRIVEAAQLSRLAKPGELISEKMIRPRKIEVKSDQANIPVTYAEAVGKCLGRFKSAGTVLRSSDLADEDSKLCLDKPEATVRPSKASKLNEREEWVIKPGENVDFHFNSGTLSLKIPAKAVQGGGTGDEITLINLQNKRRIKGVITEKGTVEYAQN